MSINLETGDPEDSFPLLPGRFNPSGSFVNPGIVQPHHMALQAHAKLVVEDRILDKSAPFGQSHGAWHIRREHQGQA